MQRIWKKKGWLLGATALAIFLSWRIWPSDNTEITYSPAPKATSPPVQEAPKHDDSAGETNVSPKSSDPASVQAGAAASVTPEEREQSRQVAISFIRCYTEYSSDQADAYLQNSKPDMTEAFFQKEMQHLKRPTLDQVNSKFQDAQLYPVASDASAEVQWNAEVELEAESVDGNKKRERVSFWLTMTHDGAAWKVSSLSVQGGSS